MLTPGNIHYEAHHVQDGVQFVLTGTAQGHFSAVSVVFPLEAWAVFLDKVNSLAIPGVLGVEVSHPTIVVGDLRSE